MGHRAFEKASLIATGMELGEDLCVCEFQNNAFVDPYMSTGPGVMAVCIVGQSACEFQDYCNHLYYIDGRCSCQAAWKLSPGLVLPASA